MPEHPLLNKNWRGCFQARVGPEAARFSDCFRLVQHGSGATNPQGEVTHCGSSSVALDLF